MKPKNPSLRSSLFFTLCTAVCLPVTVQAIDVTWDGTVDGGAATGDSLWSNADNWVGDLAPLDGDTLIFDGTTGLANTNDVLTTLATTADDIAITFAAAAGSFVLSDDGVIAPIEIGAAGNTTLVSQQSPNDQELAMDILLEGGGNSHIVDFPGAGSLTISGDLNFANDVIQLKGAPGKLILTGNNSGDGKGGAINAGTNQMRGCITTDANLTGMILVLGNKLALGNPSTDSSLQRGITLYGNNGDIDTTMELTGANKVNNTIAYYSNEEFVSDFDLEITGLIGQRKDKTFATTGAGSLIVSGNGLYVTMRADPGQNTLISPGAGSSITIDGPIHDTFQSGGIVGAQTAGQGGFLVTSTLRMNGQGTLNINADNLATWNGECYITQTNGTIKLGNANALGTWEDTTDVAVVEEPALAETVLDEVVIYVDDSAGIQVGDDVTGDGIPSGTTVVAIVGTDVTLSQAATADALDVPVTFSRTTTTTTIAGRTGLVNGNLDLNGFTINERFSTIGNGVIINSNTSTPAEIVNDIEGMGFVRVDGPGDITLPTVRLVTGTVQRQIDKRGTGTLTLGGDLANNRYGLRVYEGNVNLAKTSGDAVFSYPMQINGPTSVVKLEVSSDQLHDSVNQEINAGTFDLNGFDEACGGLNLTTGTLLSGGTITNNGAGPSTLTLGAGSAGADRTWPGTITDGTGVLSLVKGRPIVQTLTGTLSYTGDTTINEGTLELGATSALSDGSAVRINGSTSILKLADGVTDVVNELWIDGEQMAAGTWGHSDASPDHVDELHFTGTGLLSVTTGPAAAGYATWAATNAGGETADLDFDNDGTQNGVEYFLNAPAGFTAGNPVIAGSTVTWTNGENIAPDQYGTQYVLQTSTDLVDWDDVVVGDLTTNSATTLTYSVPTGPTKNFVRLVVTPN